MNSDTSKSEGNANRDFHPLIYAAIVGIAVWFLLAVWLLIAQPGYAGLVLAVVTGLIVVAVGLPIILWRISRRDPRRISPTDGSPPDESLRGWASHSVEIRPGPMKGSHAAIELLLPLLAAAIGMTLFVILAHLAVGSGV